MSYRNQAWDKFCERLNIYQSCVPLFCYSDDLIVETKTIGRSLVRTVLRRSYHMEKMVRSEADKLISDWENHNDTFDGLVYIMCLKESGRIRPLYIGKTETIGKGKRNLSANIHNLHRDTSKFARWVDNYAYHIGDLSAVVLPGHGEAKKNPKYVRWAKALFEEYQFY